VLCQVLDSYGKALFTAFEQASIPRPLLEVFGMRKLLFGFVLALVLLGLLAMATPADFPSCC